MARHNRASFAPADRQDSKRGHPGFDLRGYAGERGLEFLDHATPAGFRAALPGDEAWQHNVSRGVLPGGRFGVLAHEGLGIEADADGGISWSGTFYFTSIASRGSFSILSLIPVLNWFADNSKRTEPIRLPATTAAVRVPESAGPLTTLRIDGRRGAPPYDFGNREPLDEVGLPGWNLQSDPRPDPATLGRLLAAPVDELFAAHAGDGLFQVVVWSATLLVRRNGYLRDPGELDELAGAASRLADRIREVCLPLAAPQPFEAALPEPAWDEPGLPASFVLHTAWRQWALDTAAQRGLTLEEPRAYHRAFPSIPVPGLASVVMRGEVPGFGPGRLVVHRERESFRPAVLVPATPGAEPTPEGGVRHPEHGVVREVRDGIQATWSTTSYYGDWMAGDLDDFLARARAVS